MDTTLEVHHLANKYSHSLTEETFLFEQFLIDYMQNPEIAFQKLYSATNDPKTRQIAEDFNEEFVNTILERVEEKMLDSTPSPYYAKQTRIIQGFFADYRQHGDFSLAWENVQKQVHSDPELKDDKIFHAHLRNMADEVRPEQKVRKNMNVHDDDGVFIKVRLGLPTQYEEKRTDLELKQIIDRALRKYYASHSTNATKAHLVNIDHEVKTIFEDKQIPLALQLVYQDTQKLSKTMKGELQKLSNLTRVISKMESENVKFSSNLDSLMKELESRDRGERKKMNTDKVEIIRDLIIDLQTEPLNEAYDAAIKKAIKYGDEAILKLIEEKYKNPDQSVNAHSNTLMKAYSLYLPVETSSFTHDVQTETQNLIKGIKTEALYLGLREMEIKGNSLLDAQAINKAFQKEINEAKLKIEENKTQGKGKEKDNSKSVHNDKGNAHQKKENKEFEQPASIKGSVEELIKRHSMLVDAQVARNVIEQKKDQTDQEKDKGQQQDKPPGYKLNIN